MIATRELLDMECVHGDPGVVPGWLETPSAMFPNVAKMNLRQIDRDIFCVIATRELLDMECVHGDSCVCLCEWLVFFCFPARWSRGGLAPHLP